MKPVFVEFRGLNNPVWINVLRVESIELGIKEIGNQKVQGTIIAMNSGEQHFVRDFTVNVKSVIDAQIAKVN
ncbi:MAG: hypothetical protein INR73_13390 [Williamsia sp.]|nr:hypothetical protein [Williamsia sp.]